MAGLLAFVALHGTNAAVLRYAAPNAGHLRLQDEVLAPCKAMVSYEAQAGLLRINLRVRVGWVSPRPLNFQSKSGRWHELAPLTTPLGLSASPSSSHHVPDNRSRPCRLL